MKPKPSEPGPIQANFPEQSERRSDPLIDPEYAVYRRTAFALVAMAAVAAILYPRSEDMMDANPLAGPLILIASSEPTRVVCGALIAGLCLSAMLSVFIRPTEVTVAAAGFGVATWLGVSIFFLMIQAA